jgi:hypothetical protein
MRRFAALLLAVAVAVGGGLPTGAGAQAILTQEDDLGHGGGVAADERRVQEVTWMVEELVARINQQDPAAVDLVDPAGYPAFFGVDAYEAAVSSVEQGVPPVEVREIADVRLHDDGAYSVLVTYSGWTAWRWLSTERWYLLPNDRGSYGFTGSAPRVAQVPDALRVADVDLTYTREAMIVSETDLGGVEAVRFNVRNERYVPLTSGLYSVAAGTTEEELRADLAAADYSSVTYLGPLYTWPNQSWVYTFLVEPGMTYYLQAYEFPGATVYTDEVILLEGDQFFATLTN